MVDGGPLELVETGQHRNGHPGNHKDGEAQNAQKLPPGGSGNPLPLRCHRQGSHAGGGEIGGQQGDAEGFQQRRKAQL